MSTIQIFTGFSLLTGFLVLGACGKNTANLPIADIHGSAKQTTFSGISKTGPYFQPDVLRVIQKNCIGCHGPGSAKDWTNFNLFSSAKEKIQLRVLSANPTMPLGGRLADDDKQTLRLWIAAGMPYAAPTGSGQSDAGSPPPAPPEQPAPVPVKPLPMPDQAQSCVGCHGEAGHSTNEMFPKLAGQSPEYLQAQLTAFHGKTRADEDAQTFMWPVAEGLSAADQKLITDYFASQSAASPAVAEGGMPLDAKKIAAGQILFLNGLPDRNVPSCAACHGDKAQGNAAIPRLAGQYAAYLRKQLGYFKNAHRANDPTMGPIAKPLTDDEIQNLSEYLNSL